jgi:histidinol phosphatase-like enzyme (inositol monophosphatase family)
VARREAAAPDEADAWLGVAHALADAAAPLSMRWFRAPLDVHAKPDRSPVTHADRAVERLLRRLLAERCPDHGVSGEELGADRASADLVWFLDPIDGTASYVCGLPLWGTLIALTRRGAPLLGVIDAPAVGERWSAVRGQHAWHRPSGAAPVRCRTRRTRELAAARACLPAPDALTRREAGGARRLLRQVALRRFGGECYAYGLLASGLLDLVLESGLQAHDFLALVPVVEAAGGAISDWRGRPLTVASAGDVVAAGTRALHRQALEALSVA